MLKGQLIHPQILGALGRAGHGSQVLIADGNYPFRTKLGPNAELVSLNLSPGLVTVPQVLDALLTAMPVEAAYVMDPQGAMDTPAIWGEFRQSLDRAGASVELSPLERFAFYEAASGPDLALTIATGEQRVFANLLLTIGVVPAS